MLFLFLGFLAVFLCALYSFDRFFQSFASAPDDAEDDWLCYDCPLVHTCRNAFKE